MFRASKYKDQVFSIVEKIETQLGVKCWVDLNGIESSAQFRSIICNAIDTAEVVLFMHSSVHLDIDFQKDWTIKELNYAEAKEKRVVLVKLDNSKLDNIFLLDYGSKNNIDSRDETQFQKLLKDLRTWLNLSQKEQESNHQTTYNLKSSSKIHKIYDEDGNLQYEGEMKDGKYNGLGILYFKDGGKYIGQFENGKRHGQGTFYYASGDKYEGSFKYNKIDGKGSFYYANGDKYIGTFKNSRKSGQGTLYFANGTKYKGEFANDLIYGRGTFYDKDGEKYEGRFINGYYYSDDKYLEDQFNTVNLYNEIDICNLSNSNKNKTKLTKENNKSKETDNLTIEENYVGPLKNNKRHGMGTLYFSDGSKYEGQFEDDKFNGIGTYYFADGGKYIGQFVNGKFNGHGTNYFPDGSKYEGQFKDDKFHGQGTFYYASGNKYEGQFENGKRHGQGYYYVNGKKQLVNYNNGDLIKQTARKPRGIFDIFFGK